MRNGEKAAKLAKYRLEKNKGNKYLEARLISAWARGLCLMKKYNEAEEKVREGIALNEKEGRLYNVWGVMLQEQGKHEEAKTKLMRAFSLMQRNLNSGDPIGVSFSHLGQSDSAMSYSNQAIKVDENAHTSYYNLSKEHLLKKDMLSFFELLEKAL